VRQIILKNPDEFNWDICNDIDMKSIEFFFNGRKDVKGVQEIFRSIYKQVCKYINKSMETVWLVGEYGSGFKIIVEFKKHVRMHRTNEFINTIETIFKNNKFKKYKYDGHEFEMKKNEAFDRFINTSTKSMILQ